ncbi:MAG: alpha/beta hydrolase, partial [Nannocystaceae bacterium]
DDAGFPACEACPVPRHNFTGLRGAIETFELSSDHLGANLLGDPDTRQVAVYIPEEVANAHGPVPLFVALAPFTSSGLKLLAWQSFGESLPLRIDRLITEGKLGPLVLAMPDAFTSLGGNQYLDSPVLGRWSSFLHEDLVPALEARYPAGSSPNRRALFGRSSGGYGALVNAMERPGFWGAIASHSGDADFDLLYRSELPKAATALAAFDGDPVAFIEHLRQQPKIDGRDFYALMMLAMAASYDPQPDLPLGIHFPADPRTCALDEEAWTRWRRWDPLELVQSPARQDALRGLATLFIDCGSRDQYNLHFGNRRLSDMLTAAGITHTYEEFPDGHSGVDYRLDRSLPLLYEVLSA